MAAARTADDCCVQPLAWEVGKECFAEPAADPTEPFAAYAAAGGPVRIDDVERLRGFSRIAGLTELIWLTENGSPQEPLVPGAAARLETVAEMVSRW